MSILQSLLQADRRRAGVPGEHAAALGAGLTLLLRATRQRSTIGRALVLLAGGAMVWRAASGRDGLSKWLAPSQGRHATDGALGAPSDLPGTAPTDALLGGIQADAARLDPTLHPIPQAQPWPTPSGSTPSEAGTASTGVAVDPLRDPLRRTTSDVD